MTRQPHEVIWALTNATVASRCLQVVAELGVADALEDEPASVETLAARCELDADALDRVLRLLAAHGVFERVNGGFRHTPASQLLRSGQPMSMRAFSRMMGMPVFSATFAQLDHSVRTGSPALEAVTPGGLWPYLQEHPDEARIFDHAMTAKAGADIAAVLGAYDFSRFGTIADVAGGRGHLLRAVLDAAPRAQGVLFDLPEVVGTLDVEHERLTAHAGDFFVDELPSADAYVLMDILHDWPDAECVAILSAIRRAAPRDATLLVVEDVLAEVGADPHGRTLDVIMLAVTGGRERTPCQLAELFDAAGFSEGEVIETAGPRRIVEAQAI